MTETLALFLGGPLHGETRVLPPGVDRVEVQNLKWNAERGEYDEPESIVYEMGDDFETDGEYAGAVHFRLAPDSPEQ